MGARPRKVGQCLNIYGLPGGLESPHTQEPSHLSVPINHRKQTAVNERAGRRRFSNKDEHAILTPYDMNRVSTAEERYPTQNGKRIIKDPGTIERSEDHPESSRKALCSRERIKHRT